MNKAIISMFAILLLIFACAPAQKSQEKRMNSDDYSNYQTTQKQPESPNEPALEKEEQDELENAEIDEKSDHSDSKNKAGESLKKPFSKDNPFNNQIENPRVDENSDKYIAELAKSKGEGLLVQLKQYSTT
ncbi:hypothetical protein D6825_02955, partial [Candidatus Woesearchaeota archaeon]